MYKIIDRTAITLAELVYQLIQDKKTESPEFKALLDHYGQNKILELYESEVRLRKLAWGRHLRQ